MLLVLPVSRHDLALACLNLRLAAKLDAHCPCDLLLSAPHGLDLSELEALARSWCARTTLFRYDDWRGDPAWPRPQNWAWQVTARHVALLSPPPACWLWWEADATPLRSGWFAALADAYKAGGKPFAGHIVAGPGNNHLNGVALYPPDVRGYSIAAFLSRSAPFDRVLSIDNLPRTHSLNSLMGHYLKPPGRPSWVATPESVASLLASSLVLFHGSSDGALARALLAPTHPFAAASRKLRRLLSARPASDVTVIITNYQRPDMLWEAYASCKRAQVAHIVISSSGATDAVEAVHARIRSDHPSTRISSRRDDAGCNENWLRGASLVRTRRMTILHDDDLLLPAYERVVRGDFSADVIHWDGAKHAPAGPLPGVYVTAGTLPTGTWPITYLYQFLLNPQANTLSPVCGCFPTSHVIATLEECEKRFGPWAYLRPTMMVGNDLLLWLRACQKYRTLYYSHDPFCSYGHHAGSASFDDFTQARMKLLPIYKATRDYFVQSAPRIIHAVNRFIPSDPATLQRIHGAAISWDIGYHYEFILPRHQWAWKRDATSIGEKTPTPFLRDVLSRALSDATSKNDLIVLTNDDTIVNQYWWFAALDASRSRGAACSFRRNIAPADLVNCWLYPDKPIGTRHCGRDAFFFTQDWLKAHLAEIPDYIMGFCDWDSTLAMLIRLSHGHKSTAAEFSEEHPASELESRFIYHIDHSARWAQSFNQRGNQHSRALTTEWFNKHLGWEMPKLRGSW